MKKMPFLLSFRGGIAFSIMGILVMGLLLLSKIFFFQYYNITQVDLPDNMEGFSTMVKGRNRDSCFDLINIYLKSGSNNADKRSRKNHLHNMCNAATGDGAHCFLAGDFNFITKSSERVLLSNRLRAPRIDQSEVELLHHITKEKRQLDEVDNEYHTFVMRGNIWTSKLDRIYTNLSCADCMTFDVQSSLPPIGNVEDGSRWISDHRPVVITVCEKIMCPVKKNPNWATKSDKFVKLASKYFHSDPRSVAANPWAGLESLDDAIWCAYETIRKGKIIRATQAGDKIVVASDFWAELNKQKVNWNRIRTFEKIFPDLKGLYNVTFEYNEGLLGPCFNIGHHKLQRVIRDLADEGIQGDAADLKKIGKNDGDYEIFKENALKKLAKRRPRSSILLKWVEHPVNHIIDDSPKHIVDATSLHWQKIWGDKGLDEQNIDKFLNDFDKKDPGGL